MQAMESARGEKERVRVQAVVDTLAAVRTGGATLREIAHDARNMVTAMTLYCDLLAEPGVLSDGHAHYADELRLVTAASRRLIEKLMLLDDDDSRPRPSPPPDGRPAEGRRRGSGRSGAGDRMPNDPIANLQQELLANRNLIDAMAGLAIDVRVRTEGGARPVRLSAEDLTRILVNLVKNAAEAMRGGGSIQITLRDLPDPQGGVPAVVMIVEDSGPGIPEHQLEKIFDAGYTTHTGEEAGWPATHRGLGLSITRSIIEAAGGRISAANRPQGGGRFEIELPIRMR